MKDYLQDIVQHTQGLGVIELVKITGDSSSTLIEAISEDRSVIVQGQFNNPMLEFAGVFGMPNLGKLKTILGIDEYRENAQITLRTQDRNGESIPVGIHFENKSGDFKNDYRFMTADIISEKLKSVKMRTVNWNISVNPTVAAIQKLKFQSQANSEEINFLVKTENNKLKFFFGDHSSHAGNFVFQDGVSGSLSKSWSWPVGVVISILGLPGEKVMRFSDEGVLQITVDSGFATYNYLLPAQTK